MSALLRSIAFATSTGQLSRVRAGSLCEPESRSHDGPPPPTATASRWTCGLVRSTNAWKSNLSCCRFREAPVTETSVHNAVQPLTHARGTARSAGVDHVLGDEWLNIRAGAHRRRDTSPARQPLPESSLGPAQLTPAGPSRPQPGVCEGRADQRHRAVPGFEEHAEPGASEDDRP